MAVFFALATGLFTRARAPDSRLQMPTVESVFNQSIDAINVVGRVALAVGTAIDNAIEVGPVLGAARRRFPEQAMASQVDPHVASDTGRRGLCDPSSCTACHTASKKK